MSMSPYQIGREAFRLGRNLSDCPYHTPPSVREWKAGWYYEAQSIVTVAGA